MTLIYRQISTPLSCLSSSFHTLFSRFVRELNFFLLKMTGMLICIQQATCC